ncbi:MAG: ATP-binding protein [Spirochaetaceae bacterium]|nr:MAG: ATP-binding protein [Spirochaetaceae bacterium]
MKYIHRDLEKQALNAISTFPAVVITGPRQSGKTTLLKNLLPDYSYITFDDPLERERAAADPNLFLEQMGDKIIIDEIQYVPELLSYIKIRIDENRGEYGRFVLTGSQQFSLMKNIGDSLAGRIAILELLPFSVTEMPEAGSQPGRKRQYISACLRGSYPEVVINHAINRDTWYGSYYQTYLERDVRLIYNIGNLREFQQFLRLLAARCGEVLNLSNFGRDLGISVPTLKSWLSVLEASRIIYALMPWYNNLGKRITKAPKIYFLDTGFVCYLAGLTTPDHVTNGTMAGKLFENFVVQETIKHFIHKGKQPPIFYFRTNNQLEIDLVIENDINSLLPVEIKLTGTPKMADTAGLSRFSELFPGKVSGNLILVSLAKKTVPLDESTVSAEFNNFLKMLP